MTNKILQRISLVIFFTSIYPESMRNLGSLVAENVLFKDLFNILLYFTILYII